MRPTAKSPYSLSLLAVALLVGCAGAPAATPTPSAVPTAIPSAGPASSPAVSTLPSLPQATSSPVGPATSPGPASPIPGSGDVTDRYADGLPRSIDGQPVLRGAAALAHAKSATDDTPFLITGWVTYLRGAVYSCPANSGDGSWLHDCGTAALGDVAGAQDPALAKAVTFRFVSDSLSSGPTVAEVEVHDPRTATCGSTAPACDRLMVAQRIVWSGDQATAPQPLSAASVSSVIQGLQHSAALTPFGPGSSIQECGSELTSADLYLVANDWTMEPAVTIVEVEPSAIARNRALSVPTGAPGALKDAAVACSILMTAPGSAAGSQYRWLAVANVALLVRTSGPTAADKAFLASLAAGLEQAATRP